MRGAVLGEYFADVYVERCLIGEQKAAREIADEHVAQRLGYRRAARVEHGLIINFGAARFAIRKYAMSKIIADNASPPMLHDAHWP